ncbi:MAG: MarR family transcriptional regulator [Alphaproteobacteria bacterium]|nr:MarR family transcriptional regulator [Alphaproteobacteria bacterium]
MKLTSAALESQLEKVRELESQLTFRIAVLSKRLDQQVVALLKDTPLNLTSYRILVVIDTFEEISISDISRFNAIDRAQVSRTAIELEKQGLVTFRSDPSSRRKKMVVLTEAGQALLDDLHPRFEARQKKLEQGLGPEAHQALWQGITKLAEAVSP